MTAFLRRQQQSKRFMIRVLILAVTSFLTACTSQVQYVEVDHGCRILPKKIMVSVGADMEDLQQAERYLKLRKVACND